MKKRIMKRKNTGELFSTYFVNLLYFKMSYKQVYKHLKTTTT